MNEEHRIVISIPINVKDLNVIEEEIPWEEIQFEDFEFTVADFENLWELFSSFDAPFGIGVDLYEEEILPAHFVKPAIRMTEKYSQHASPNSKASAEKLMKALKRADELGKQVVFFF